MNGQSMKWHRMTAEDAVLELDSNAACGLSRKAARSRRRRHGANDFFDEPPKRVRGVLKQYWADPAILLFAFAALFALCFLEIVSGIVALIAFLGWEGFLLYFAVRINNFQSSVSAYRIPTACVIREGRRLIVSARHIVKGDVLLLSAGDVVPADCRLLTQQNLRVRVLQPGTNGQPEWSISQKSADRIYPYSSELSVFQYENLLLAGSEILSGEARATVVAIGKETCLFQSAGSLPPAEIASRQADPMRQLRPYLKLDSILLLAWLLPITLLSFLSAWEGADTFELFLPVCAVICAGAFSLISFCCHVPFYQAREICFSEKKNRGILKSAGALENLASVSDIFILGRIASSDGKVHLNRVTLGGREISLGREEKHPELQNLCEAYLLLSKILREQYEAAQEPPVMDDRPLLKELLKASDFDREALDVRLSQVGQVTEEKEGILLEVAFKEDRFQLLFTDRIQATRQCLFLEDGESVRIFSDEDRARLKRFEQESLEQGCRILAVMKNRDGRRIFVGAMALREDLQDGLADTVLQLKQSGVRVTFFLEDARQSTLLYANLAGLPSPLITTGHLAENGGALADYYEKYRCFCGFSKQEIMDLLTLCQSRGRRVAVLGHNAGDYRLFCRANLSVACDVTEYHKKAVEESLLGDLTQIGSRQSDRCAPMLRRKADLLIGRAHRTGGGLATLLHCVQVFRAAGFRARALLPVLATSQFLLLLYAVLGRCFGFCTFNVFQALFAGMAMMLLLTFRMQTLEIPQKRLHKWLPPNAAYLKATFRSRAFLLPVLLSGILPCMFTAILVWCGILDHASASCYLFGSLVLIELAAFLRHTGRRGISIRQKNGVLTVLMGIGSVALLATLSTWIPAVNAVTGLGYWDPITLLTLPLPPLVYYLSGKLCDFLGRTTK